MVNSVLGFDISTNATGWCHYAHPGKYTLGVLVPPKKATFEEKLLHLHYASGALIHEFKPDVVVVESVFAYKNVKTSKILSEAGGMVKLNCYMQHIPVVIIENTEVKGFFAAKKKEDLFEVVTKLTGLDALGFNFDECNDIVDSFALILYYLQCHAKQVFIKEDGSDTINFMRARYEY